MEQEPRHTILIVDDAVENITILGTALHDEHDVLFATTGEEALETLASERDVDLVLLDIMLPGISGYEVCARLKDNEETAGIPVIFVSAKDREKDETRGLELGAVDYITKPFSLPIVRARVRTHLELKSKTDLLEQYAQVDGLTGLQNRRRFDEMINREWRRAARSGDWLSLLMIDIDEFKAYNDCYGHLDGDGCLKRIASLLQGCASRASDVVARYGGEEFVVLLPGLDGTHAAEVARRIQEAARAATIPHAQSSVSDRVTVSIGVASTRPTTEEQPEQLISDADRRLYQAKESGRDRVVGA